MSIHFGNYNARVSQKLIVVGLEVGTSFFFTFMVQDDMIVNPQVNWLCFCMRKLDQAIRICL